MTSLIVTSLKAMIEGKDFPISINLEELYAQAEQTVPTSGFKYALTRLLDGLILDGFLPPEGNQYSVVSVDFPIAVIALEEKEEFPEDEEYDGDGDDEDYDEDYDDSDEDLESQVSEQLTKAIKALHEINAMTSGGYVVIPHIARKMIVLRSEVLRFTKNFDSLA